MEDQGHPIPAEQPRSTGETLLDRLPPAVDHLLVGVLAAAVLWPGLGGYGLHDPWETHYGEVARNMVESGDWISPWWGSYWPEEGPCVKDSDCPAGHVCRSIRGEYLPRPSTCRPTEFNREGKYFFSKPVLSMWLMAGSMSLLGVSEFAVRLPFTLCAIIALMVVVWSMSLVFDRRSGRLAGLVLLTSPMFFLISRQAMTDGPFVSMLTAGMGFLVAGLFGPDRPLTSRARWAFGVALTALVVPQALLLTFGLEVYLRALGLKFFVGAFHGVAYLVMLGVALWFLKKARSSREVYLWTFYLFAGLASLAKGLLGVAIPGAVLVLYMLITRSWRLLRRMEIPKGSLVFAAVAFPWYGAMFARHLRGFFDRFFIHDHLKRLTSGVHSLDSGGFEYVLLWFGLGMLPWIGLVPAAIARATTWDDDDTREPVRLLLVWFLLPAVLISLSSTKFHHYMLPLVPPAAMLVALLLARFDRGARGAGVSLALASGIVAAVAVDLAADQHLLVNLFTYKYDRAWPSDVDLMPQLTLFAGAFLVALTWLTGATSRAMGLAVGLAVAFGAAALPTTVFEALQDASGLDWAPWVWRAATFAVVAALAMGPVPFIGRGAALAGLVLVAVAFGTWSQTGYMKRLTDKWSQARIFQAYYADCTKTDPKARTMAGHPVCKEPIAAYKMNWRGETFYSENRVIPLLSDKEAKYFLKTSQGKAKFYAIVEYTRLQSQFRKLFDQERFRAMRRVFEDNSKFVLLEVPPLEGPEGGDDGGGRALREGGD